MLENFPLRNGSDELKLQRRVLAVAAALEIAKVSASASGRTHSDKVADDLQYAAQHIEKLADAILAVIEK